MDNNSCAMVLDTLGKPVTVESLIASVRPTEKGILSKDVADMLCRNKVETIFLNGRTINDLSRYTDKGTPVIVRIIDSKNPQDFSHFVVVDGITERSGQKWLQFAIHMVKVILVQLRLLRKRLLVRL